MNSGRACKNLTDGLVLLAAAIALIGFVERYTGFEAGNTMLSPTTKEKMELLAPLDDPYTSTYLKLFIAFVINALIGFSSRNYPLVGVVASLCAIVISLNYFSDQLIKTYGFLYVLVAVTGLAGSLVYAYFDFMKETDK